MKEKEEKSKKSKNAHTHTVSNRIVSCTHGLRERREMFIWWGLHRAACNMYGCIRKIPFIFCSLIYSFADCLSFCMCVCERSLSPRALAQNEKVFSCCCCCWRCLLSINRFVHFQSMWMWKYFSGFQWGIEHIVQSCRQSLSWKISTYTLPWKRFHATVVKNLDV